MRKLLTVIFDTFFPPSPSQKILDSFKGEPKNLYSEGVFESVTYLSHYQDPFIKAAIKENKFHHNKTASKFLAEILDEWVKKQDKDIVFIPIPLGSNRQRERGHNQVESILASSSKQLNIMNNLLYRVTETTPQSHLPRKERLLNMHNVFEIKDISGVAGKHIVVIDDVVTTGATLKAARAKLAPHLPSNTTISCVAIAH